MTSCDQFQERLDALADGTLADAEAAELRAHLAGCPSCRETAEEAADLRRRLAALPTEVAPARDLWPAIARRIEGQRVVALERARSPWRRRLVQLAAAAALVIVSSGVTAYLVRQRPVPTPVPRSAEPGAVRAALRPAQASFRSARATLLDALEQRRSSLDPETLRVVDQNLAIIDAAIARITGALERNPDNRELAQLLAGAYRREIDLLERAAELPSSVGGET